MVKRVVSFLLVASLVLTATPAALSMEALSPSISSGDGPSNHPQLSGDIQAPSLECVEESQVNEVDASEIFLDRGELLDQVVPSFHRRSTHARNAHRSRVPAVIHGRSPPR